MNTTTSYCQMCFNSTIMEVVLQDINTRQLHSAEDYPDELQVSSYYFCAECGEEDNIKL